MEQHEATLQTLSQLTEYRSSFLEEMATRLAKYQYKNIPRVEWEKSKVYAHGASQLYEVAAKKLKALGSGQHAENSYDQLIPDFTSVDDLVEFTHKFSTYLSNAPDGHKKEVQEAAQTLLSAKQELASLSEMLRPYQP